MSRHVAIDLGASGGRVALGTVAGGRLHVDVLHRFSNGGSAMPAGIYWDHLALWREAVHGLRLASEFDSVGVNSWGVDYGLVDGGGLLIDGIRHYRDPRTQGMEDEVFRIVPRTEIYQRTGIQFMALNTLYQLAAHDRQSPGILRRAKHLFLVPDLFHFWLCGSRVTERTIAGTTQLYNPETRDWDWDLIDALGFPRGMFCPIVEPGTAIGSLSIEGLPTAQVVAPAAHDTASAVAAVPAEGEDWAYVSSGTWALAGVEVQQPVISDRTQELNLTNEAGVRGTTRLLKNITGLWILQECRRAWSDPDFAELYREAAASSERGSIDPDDARFHQVCDDMPEKVQSYCRDIGRAAPATRGDITRCILNGLAAKTAEVIDGLEGVTGREIRRVHIVGGGSQIDVLNQLIADMSGRTVVAGPVDATLIGNLLVQAESLGSIEPGTIRDVVRRSFELRRFEPS